MSGDAPVDLHGYYRRALRRAWEDGRITSDERKILSELSPGLGTDGVERTEAREYFRARWKGYASSPPAQRLELLEEALSFDPENEYLWSERAAALYQSGRLEESLGSADRCLSLSSGSFDAWFWKGSVLVRKGRYQDASECFEDALEIDPDNVLAWLMLGWTERARKEYPKSRACYDRVLELCPDLALAYIERAMTSVKDNDLGAAQTDLLRSLDKDPGNERALEMLASIGADAPVKVAEGKAGPVSTEATASTMEVPSVGPTPGAGTQARAPKVVVIEEPDEVVTAKAMETGPVQDVRGPGPGSEVGTGRQGADVTATPGPTSMPIPGEAQNGTVFKWMRCPHCGDDIPLTTMERPLVITCKNCGAKGKLVR